MDDAQARRVQAWIDGYVRAWNSTTQPTSARSSPRTRPITPSPTVLPEGRDEIVRQWLDRKDEPGQAQFTWHPLAVTSEVAVIQGEVAYPSEATPTATCGSSASTPKVAAPSSPSGGCATPARRANC